MLMVMFFKKKQTKIPKQTPPAPKPNLPKPNQPTHSTTVEFLKGIKWTKQKDEACSIWCSRILSVLSQVGYSTQSLKYQGKVNEYIFKENIVKQWWWWSCHGELLEL